MSYLDPNLVTSPKNAINDLEVLHDGGEQGDYGQEGLEDWMVGWSLAKMKWHGNEAFAMRWNGGTNEGSPLGNPQSRGIAMWFILPQSAGEMIFDRLQGEKK